MIRPPSTVFARCASATLVFAALAISCSDPRGPGERCIADADCEGELGCYRVDATSSRRCLAPCDPATVVLCTEEAEGSLGLCAAIEGAGTPGACLSGGVAEQGDACASSLDCAASGICVVTGSAGVCERACDAAAPDCPVGEACTVLGASGSRGYCVVAPDGGV